MRTRIVPAALALLVLAGVASGQVVDWDADNYGLFFDTAGTTTGLTAAPGSTVTAYLVVIEPTFSGIVTRWTAPAVVVAPFTGYFGYPEGEGLPVAANLLHGGVDQWSGSCYVDGGLTHALCFDVVCAAPVTAGAPTVLAEITFTVVADTEIGLFDLWGGLAVELADGSARTLGTSTRAVSTMPPMWWRTATVNSSIVPVSEEITSWGACKAVFR